MENLNAITGTVQRIQPISEDCCRQMITIQNAEGVHNFIISPETYVIDMIRIRPGMTVTAFYDANLPVPLIYPPQYQAVIIGRNIPNENICVL